jgi:hypothetical protein
MLRLRGPVRAEVWASVLGGFVVSVKRLRIPGLDVLEVALRVDPSDAPLIAQPFVAAVRARGWDPGAMSGSKTQLILDRLWRGPQLEV